MAGTEPIHCRHTGEQLIELGQPHGRSPVGRVQASGSPATSRFGVVMPPR